MPGPQILRSDVPPEKDYARYRENLRVDFVWCCAYCTLAESEAQAISFEIDHYLPRSRFPEKQADYDNLYYSCSKCNAAKSDYAPNPEQHRLDLRFVKIDEEDPFDHVYLDEDGERLKAATPLGEFNIEELFLNREMLRKIRILRGRLYESRVAIGKGLRAIHRKGLPDSYHKRSERYEFLRLRDKITEMAKANERTLFEELRERLRSPNADPEPVDSPEARQRRQYRKRIRAIVPTKPKPKRGELG